MANAPAPAPAPAPAAKPPVQAPPTPAAKGPEVPPSPAPAAAQAPAAPAPAPKPVNQLEQELAARFEKDGVKWEELNPKVRESLIASEMKSREADKRMQLTAKLKRDLDMTTAQANQLIEALKKDPWRVLSNPLLGHDVRKMAESYVWDRINEQRIKNSMPPEQWDAIQKGKEAQAELQQLRAQQDQAKREQEKREQDALTQQRREYWEKTIAEAIDGEKLPKTSYVVRRFTDFIRASVRARVPADMPKIASQIKQELVDLQGRFLLPPKIQGETDEQYEERVLNGAPNDYIKMLRKADLRKLRAKGLAPRPGPRPTSAPGQKSDKRLSMTEWLNQRDARLGRK